MKRIPLIFLFLFAAQVASAQDWAQARLAKSPRHREWVTIKHDGRSLETFVAYPEAKDKRPVVLIIHEIFGLSDWAQELTDEVAEAGYIAVAPDLLSGMGPNGGRTNSFPEGGATEAVGHLSPDQVTADLNAAADYALKLPSSNGKIFVAGFCWGGAQTFRFATNRARYCRRFRVLRLATGESGYGADQGAGLRLLRRKRRAHRRHRSRERCGHESCRQELTTR